MITKFFSLIKPLFVRIGYIMLKCVNPPSVGAVLAVIVAVTVFQPLEIQAATVNKDIDLYISSFSDDPHYSENQEIHYSVFDNKNGLPACISFDRIILDIPVSFNYQYYMITNSGSPSYYNRVYTLDIAYVKLHLIINGKEYIIDPVYSTFKDGNGNINKYASIQFSNEISRLIKIYTNYVGNSDISNAGRMSIYAFVELGLSNQVNVIEKNINTLEVINPSGDDYYFDDFNIGGKLSFIYEITDGEEGVSSVDYDNATIDSIERNTEQLQEYHELDRTDAEQAGSDMTGFASQLDNLKNTWSILWYPIEFTNRFIQVFVGGTQSAIYEDEYQYVTGYRYNDETGFLEPVMARTAQPVSAGTGITFPSFELMGMTIWDSYTYDLSSITSQFPVIFDSLYVIVSILEMLWFVSYLRNKYDEVFG